MSDDWVAMARVLLECYEPRVRADARRLAFDGFLGGDPGVYSDAGRRRLEEWINTAPVDEIARVIYPESSEGVSS